MTQIIGNKQPAQHFYIYRNVLDRRNKKEFKHPVATIAVTKLRNGWLKASAIVCHEKDHFVKKVSLAKAYGKLLSKGPNVFVAKNDVELVEKIATYLSSKNNYILASANWMNASYAMQTVINQLKLV
jgi:hypothetical protein